MLEQKIQNTKNKLYDYIKLVDQMIDQIITGALAEDWDKVQEVFDVLEHQANTFQMDIEQNCLGILALFHPEAIHLRSIVKMSGIASDLERMADLATKIALAIYYWKDSFSIKDYPKILEMVQEVRKMLSQVSEAFMTENCLTAVAVIEYDDRVDELCTKTLRQLIKEMNVAEEVEYLLQIMNITRNFERIGDLCVHFAENVIFIKEGLIPNKQKK